MLQKEQNKKRGEGYNWSAWEGTDTLRWTQIPDDWLDILVPQLKPAEVQVLLCIGRHTYGWKKDWDSISLNQIVEHTRLSMSAVCKATKSLERKRIIVINRRKTEEGGAAANTYSICERRGTAKNVVPPTAKSGETRYSRTRDNNENERTSVSSQLNQNDKTALIKDLHQEFAPGDPEKAIQTYLSRFPIALIQRAANITRAATNAKMPIAYMYGVLQRLQEQEGYLPAAQRRIDLETVELTPEEYRASLQALERVKQQLGMGS